MKIKRINAYRDNRFSQRVLNQHGCFLADEVPYEVEIISDDEAVIRGKESAVYPKIIEEFRFYTPHITRFYDKSHRVIQAFSPPTLLKLNLDQIQPSQFYVDEDKITAISSFIHEADDIVVQVMPYQDRYISLDGHTRLYYAVMMGWTAIRAVTETADDWIYGFVEEAQKRDIHTPYDLKLISHDQYEVNWNQFCDHFFAESEDL